MPTPCRSAGSVPVAGSARRRRRPRLPAGVPPLPAPVTTLDGGGRGADSARTVSQLIETAVPSYLSIEVGAKLLTHTPAGTGRPQMLGVSVEVLGFRSILYSVAVARFLGPFRECITGCALWRRYYCLCLHRCTALRVQPTH